MWLRPVWLPHINFRHTSAHFDFIQVAFCIGVVFTRKTQQCAVNRAAILKEQLTNCAPMTKLASSAESSSRDQYLPPHHATTPVAVGFARQLRQSDGRHLTHFVFTIHKQRKSEDVLAQPSGTSQHRKCGFKVFISKRLVKLHVFQWRNGRIFVANTHTSLT